MVEERSDSERGNLLCHIGYFFRLAARVLLYASSHRQNNTYHGLCYTSCWALGGISNSSMGPPWRIDPKTHWTMSEPSRSYKYQGGKQGCYNIYMTKPYCNQKAYLWHVSRSLTGIDPKSTERGDVRGAGIKMRTVTGVQGLLKAPLGSLGKENCCLQPLELSKTDANKSKLVITYNVRHTSQTWNSEHIQWTLCTAVSVCQKAHVIFVVVF